MPLLRFVHAADLHLDSPFVGIKAAAPENVASALRDATFIAYENIIDLCIEEQVDALLVAGDVYDSADRSLRAQLRFVEGLRRLEEAGIRSFICHGNHDPLDGWEARLDYPSSCTRFGVESDVVPVFEDDPERAVVHGISFPKQDVYENLALRFGTADSNTFSIGLVHANVGSDTSHVNYAPCSLEDLVGSEIDYWALGHVHTRQILTERSPTVVYPGNPQGRHPNERGARGVYLVEVDDTGGVRLDFKAVDVVRWVQADLDVSGTDTVPDLIEGLHQCIQGALAESDGRSVVLRIRLAGRSAIHGSLRRPSVVEDLMGEVNREWADRLPFAWCERIEDETATPFNREERVEGADFLAEVLKTVDHAKDNAELLDRLRIGLADLYEHRRYRSHLLDHAPVDGDLVLLIDEAEAIVVDLLAGDDDT